MAKRTRADLVEEVLDVLGVLSAGQAPNQEDTQKVDKKVDPVLASLKTRRVYYLANPDSIDNSVFLPLARCIAVSCASGFGLAQIDGKDVEAVRLLAENELRATTPGDQSNDPIPFESF